MELFLPRLTFLYEFWLVKSQFFPTNCDFQNFYEGSWNPLTRSSATAMF